LLGRQLYGHTPDSGNITLYPDAFANEETLATTLGHEITHVYQISNFGPALDSETGLIYERAAYAVEQSYLDYFRANG
jgi:hypothetical protein